MGRERKGTVKQHCDHWDARITLPDGSRTWIHLPPGDTEARARERAAALSERAAQGDVVLDRGPDGGPELLKTNKIATRAKGKG